jgi:membrane protein implicated in regulation of membrane protease activity
MVAPEGGYVREDVRQRIAAKPRLEEEDRLLGREQHLVALEAGDLPGLERRAAEEQRPDGVIALGLERNDDGGQRRRLCIGATRRAVRMVTGEPARRSRTTDRVSLCSLALTVAIILAFFAPWPWNLIAVLTGLAIETVELTWGLRLARRWRPQTGAEAMIGKEAEVVAPCRPTGQVRVDGELWEAYCDEGAETGETVRIDRLDGLTLVVSRQPKSGSHPSR